MRAKRKPIEPKYLAPIIQKNPTDPRVYIGRLSKEFDRRHVWLTTHVPWSDNMLTHAEKEYILQQLAVTWVRGQPEYMFANINSAEEYIRYIADQADKPNLLDLFQATFELVQPYIIEFHRALAYERERRLALGDDDDTESVFT